MVFDGGLINFSIFAVDDAFPNGSSLFLVCALILGWQRGGLSSILGWPKRAKRLILMVFQYFI